MAAENVAKMPNAAAAQVGQNEVLIVGRVDKVKEWEGQDGSSGYITHVKLPAADQYSSASTVEVSTRRKLGRQGDEIKQLCRLTGFLKRGRNDKGEAYEFVNMRLVAVEE